MNDEPERDEEEKREDDEAFLGVWREWHLGRTREEAEEMIGWMLAHRSPW